MGEPILTEEQMACLGCRYWSNWTSTCDFCILEGRRRPCRPGSACTLYQPGRHPHYRPFAAIENGSFVCYIRVR